MRKEIFLLCLSVLCGCTNNPKIVISIENSSDLKDTINIQTYLNDRIVNDCQVIRDHHIIHYKSFVLDLPKSDSFYKLEFRIPSTNYVSSCHIQKSQLTSKAWMHVNLIEKVFKKGDYFHIGRKPLDKDTLVKSQFYCELLTVPQM